MSKKIYVVGRDTSVEFLFEDRGHEVHAGDLPNCEVDLVVFTGGSDINPALYGALNMGSYVTEYSKRRDTFEVSVYKRMTELGIPKAGICRGGQLFNILNGGSMVQDIKGHNGGNHEVYLYDTHDPIGKTNSCHHQMMIPTEGVELIAYSTYSGGKCPEVIYYPENKDLCFQAHPEWGHENTTRLFFQYIDSCLGVSL